MGLHKLFIIIIFFFNRPSFYPCPPSVIDDEQAEFDPFDYLQTYVSKIDDF